MLENKKVTFIAEKNAKYYTGEETVLKNALILSPEKEKTGFKPVKEPI